MGKDKVLRRMINNLTADDLNKIRTNLLFKTYSSREEANNACDILTRLNHSETLYPVVSPINEGFVINIEKRD